MSSAFFRYQLRQDLYCAFLEARKRKMQTSNEFKFEINAFSNLEQLYTDILNRNYCPSRGIAFVNKKPVIREIFAAPFRDRIVHHLIVHHVEKWWDNHFIYDSYSCRKGKGTDFGIRRLYHMMRKVSNNFHIPTSVLKYDLQGYFTSLPRDRLYERALWGLQRQFLHDQRNSYDEEVYSMLEFLWHKIIFDDPVQNVTVKGEKALWRKLPRRKSLFAQPPGVGIVIGNLTSQVLSNVYLDQLDRFIVHVLGFKNYGRYVDDFFIVVPTSEVTSFRRYVEPRIEDYIIGLGLTLHPQKRLCLPIEKGVPFLGARLYPYRILPDYRTINNYRRDMEYVISGNKDIDSLISYMGRLQHFDAQHLQQRIWRKAGLCYRLNPHGGPSSRYYTDPKDCIKS